MGLFNNLIFHLGLKTEGFNSEMDKAVKRTKKASQEMSHSFTSEFEGKLKGLFGAAAIGEGVRELIKFGSEVKDISERINANVASVQDLMLASKLGGGDIGDIAGAFDKLAKAMEKARAGGKEGDAMRATLEALGATGQDLASMNVDRVFRAIADSVEDLAGNSQSSAQFIEVFGRSGTKLVPMMKELAQLKPQLHLDQEDVNAWDALGDHFSKLAHNAKIIYGGIGASLIQGAQFIGRKLGMPDTRPGFKFPGEPGALARLPGLDAEETKLGAEQHMKDQDRILELEKETEKIAERNRLKRLPQQQQENELLMEKRKLMEQLALAQKLFPGTENLFDAETKKRIAELDSEILDVQRKWKPAPIPNDSLLSVGNFLGAAPDSSVRSQLEQQTRLLKQIDEHIQKQGGIRFNE